VAFQEEEVIDTAVDKAVEPENLDVDETVNEDDKSEGKDEAEAPLVFPEEVMLPLPSNIISVEFREPLESLRLVERELQKGQANDSLEGLRVALANKSLLLLTNVNQSTTTKQSTWAWAGVQNAQTHVLSHAHSYQRAWQALKCVGTPENLLVYQKLDVKDLVTVKDITMAKHFGQESDSLAWFWHIGPNKDALTGEWLEECKLKFLLFLIVFGYTDWYIWLVYCVNWLRAKAHVDRWLEEATLVKHEMQWTIMWFQHQVNLWTEHSKREDVDFIVMKMSSIMT
jgi:hypothetical protein